MKIKRAGFMWIFYIIVAVIGVSIIGIRSQSVNKKGQASSLVENIETQVQTKSKQDSKIQNETEAEVQYQIVPETEGQSLSEIKQPINETETKQSTDETQAKITPEIKETQDAKADNNETRNESVADLRKVVTAGKTYKVNVINATYVNIRITNESKAKVIGVLKKGEPCILVEAGRYCSLIKANGIEGYVFNKYIEAVPQ